MLYDCVHLVWCHAAVPDAGALREVDLFQAGCDEFDECPSQKRWGGDGWINMNMNEMGEDGRR